MSIKINPTAYTPYTGAAASPSPAVESEKNDRPGDGFEKQPVFATDTEKIHQMKSQLQGNLQAFRLMVQGAFEKQGGFADTAAGFSLKNLFENLQVDEDTRLAAQAAIAENGEWGVEATASRIVEFAKALSGEDTSKIQLLKNAVLDGFAKAASVWGGNMPDITQKTQDRIMELFDLWENPPAEEPAPAEA